MNRIGGRPNGGYAVLLWLCCILAICAGYYLAFDLFQKAIDEQHAVTTRVSDTIRADAEIIGQRPALERELRVVEDRARSFDLHADRAAMVARFVQTAARIAGEQHVSLKQVDARGAGGVPATSRPTPQNGDAYAFEAIPLEVLLGGGYGALLATIRELADAPLPMQIEIAAIERNAPGPGGAFGAEPLTARLHLVLQRLTDDAPVRWPPYHISEDVTDHARFH